MKNVINAGITGFDKIGTNFWDHCQILAQIGYKTNQGAVMALQAMAGNLEENIARYRELGMVFYSTMVAPGKTPIQFDYFAKPTILQGYHDLVAAYQVEDEQIEKTIATCEKFGINIVTQYATPILNPRFGLKDCERDVFYDALEKMEATAEQFKKAGIHYCYHNHDLEFTTCYDGITAFDHFLTRTSELNLELDVGWVLVAGEDPEQVFTSCASRIHSLHLKDLVPGTWVREATQEVRPTFTALGTGMLNLEGFLKTAVEHDFKWVIVEQDDMRNLSELETAKAAFLNMKETGWII